MNEFKERKQCRGVRLPCPEWGVCVCVQCNSLACMHPANRVVLTAFTAMIGGHRDQLAHVIWREG
jgi:hypothetical protein